MAPSADELREQVRAEYAESAQAVIDSSGSTCGKTDRLAERWLPVIQPAATAGCC